MKQYAVANKLRLVEKAAQPRKQLDQYYSVEFLIDELNISYQFKIWNRTIRSVLVLVKEDSAILPWLSAGNRLKMRCYSTDSAYPSEYLEPVIRHITRNNQGPLRGHYLVSLGILKSPNQENID